MDGYDGDDKHLFDRLARREQSREGEKVTVYRDQCDRGQQTGFIKIPPAELFQLISANRGGCGGAIWRETDRVLDVFRTEEEMTFAVRRLNALGFAPWLRRIGKRNQIRHLLDLYTQVQPRQ
jgi:hypothetical protein